MDVMGGDSLGYDSSLGDARHIDGDTSIMICESNLKNLSPILTVAPLKLRCVSSPEEIPSYKINQNTKRFLDLSEEPESVLPAIALSPVSTPPSVQMSSTFFTPLVPVLDFNEKNDFKGKFSSRETVTLKCTAYDQLGMVDKDISWESSMETPAPQSVPLDKFNTIERATFLPEDNLKNMQPRVLFSPTRTEESDCMPLHYTSESDEETDIFSPRNQNENKLSTPLEFMTGSPTIKCPTQEITEGSAAKNFFNDSCEMGKAIPPVSPVFSIQRNKKKLKKRKSKKTLLVDSPSIVSETVNEGNSKPLEVNENSDSKSLRNSDCNLFGDENETICKEDNSVNANQNCGLNEQTHSIQDDSFQDISFSCIDELCKNSVDEKNFSSVAITSVLSDSNRENCFEEGNIFKFNPSLPFKSKKMISNKEFYYHTEGTGKLLPLSSVTSFLSSTKKLEEGNVSVLKKFDRTLSNRGIAVFSEMIKDYPKLMSSTHEAKQSGKRLRQDISENSPTDQKRKMFKSNDESIPELVTSENNMLEKISEKVETLEVSKGQTYMTTEIDLHNNSEKKACVNMTDSFHTNHPICETGDNSLTHSLPMFSSALGKPISVSNDAFKRVQSIFEEEIHKTDSTSGFQGFQTASGSVINVSEKSLRKVKSFFREFETDEDHTGNSRIGFTTASGCPITVSEEALQKAKMALVDDYEPLPPPSTALLGMAQRSPGINSKTNAGIGFTTASGSAVKISEEALKKARAALGDDYCSSAVPSSDTANNVLNKDLSKITEIPAMNPPAGFMTASGSAIKVSEEALKKARLTLGEDYSPLPVPSSPPVGVVQKFSGETTEISTVNRNIGFTTASGSAIKVSEEALKKARTVLGDDNCSLPINSSDTINNILQKDSGKITEIPAVKPSTGFMTASGSSIKVSEEALKKARMALGEDYGNVVADERSCPLAFKTASDNHVRTSNESPCAKEHIETRQKSSELEVESTVAFCCSTASETNIASERHPERSRGISREDLASKNQDGNPTHNSVDISSEDDSSLIPSWLHAYTTSPTLTMERTIASEECHQHSTPIEQYLIKSPVLGTTDRFYNRRKRSRGRKLIFSSSPKPSPSQRNKVKKDSSELNIDFAIPFKRQRMESEVLSNCVTEGREKARVEQRKAAKKESVKPCEGSMILKKTQPQLSWSAGVGQPEQFDVDTLRGLGVREDVLEVTATNASEYKFTSLDFYAPSDCCNNIGGFSVGDGCLLIFDDSNKAGIDEFARAFFACPGVQPNLISSEWIRNHYRWIVWKLSHYERSFPRQFAGRGLTPHNVMVQLKYRYDREIDRGHRSALKKILERDESASKRIVLCIFDVRKIWDLNTKSTENLDLLGYKLGLTDGWYSCYATVDHAMIKFIENGRVSVGTKIVTHGAELLNCEQGISPLEITDNVYFKIFTNSTRRVKWYSKLGFQKYGGPILVSLNSILPQGGLVGRIDVVVVRTYPILYIEKKADGTHVTRNRRSEDKAAALFQQQQEQLFEKLYQQVKDEIKSKERECGKQGKNLSISDIPNVTDPEELHRLYKMCSDPCTFQSLINREQRDILINYVRKQEEVTHNELSAIVQEKIKNEKLNDRKITQFTRVKIVDLHKPDYRNPVVLTLWNLTEDTLLMMTEGKAITIYCTTCNTVRSSRMVQLNSTRHTQYKELSIAVDHPVRKATRLSELTADFEPYFNEVDCVGIVAFIHETSYGSRMAQTVFIADSESNYAGIVFWGSCKDFGWENVLTPNAVVACANLQWSRNRNFRCIPNMYVVESTVFTENPKHAHLKEEMERLRASLPKDTKNFVTSCAEEITEKLHDKSTGPMTPVVDDFDISARLRPKYTNAFKMRPNASSTPYKSLLPEVDLVGQEPSPIQKRIEKLQAYGEPPPLSPLLPLDNLEKFKTKFKVPFKNSNTSGDLTTK